MMDGRDLINLADWIEDRKDAVGPYPNHINDGFGDMAPASTTTTTSCGTWRRKCSRS